MISIPSAVIADVKVNIITDQGFRQTGYTGAVAYAMAPFFCELLTTRLPADVFNGFILMRRIGAVIPFLRCFPEYNTGIWYNFYYIYIILFIVILLKGVSFESQTY